MGEVSWHEDQGPHRSEGKFWICPECTGEPWEGLSAGGIDKSGFVPWEAPQGGCAGSKASSGERGQQRGPRILLVAHEAEGRVESEMFGRAGDSWMLRVREVARTLPCLIFRRHGK